MGLSSLFRGRVASVRRAFTRFEAFLKVCLRTLVRDARSREYIVALTAGRQFAVE
jgi:hypothetical protein